MGLIWCIVLVWWVALIVEFRVLVGLWLGLVLQLLGFIWGFVVKCFELLFAGMTWWLDIWFDCISSAFLKGLCM